MNDTILDSAQAGFRALFPQAATLAKNSRVYDTLARKLSRPEGYGDLKALSRDLEKLNGLALDVGDIVEHARIAVDQARRWLTNEWERRAKEFASDLGSFFGARGIEVQHVESGLRAHPLLITLHTAQDRATLTFAGETVGKALPLDTERIFRGYADALAHLEREQTPPEFFADALIEAYEDARRRRSVREGARVRLPDVHFSLFVARQTAAARSDPRRARLKEYPRYQFAWDLSLLQKHPDWCSRGDRQIVLHTASTSAARGKADSIQTITADGSEVVLGDMHVATN